MSRSTIRRRRTPALLLAAPLYGIAIPLRAQTTGEGPAPVADAGSPTPATGHSGWSDIGPWGLIGLAVVLVIVLVLLFGRRRRRR